MFVTCLFTLPSSGVGTPVPCFRCGGGAQRVWLAEGRVETRLQPVSHFMWLSSPHLSSASLNFLSSPLPRFPPFFLASLLNRSSVLPPLKDPLQIPLRSEQMGTSGPSHPLPWCTGEEATSLGWVPRPLPCFPQGMWMAMGHQKG